VIGREGAVGNAYLALIFLGADGQELGRRVRWIDDFSGEAKEYTVRALPIQGATSVVSGFRVNTELPPNHQKVVTSLSVQSLDPVQIVQEAGLAEMYDQWTAVAKAQEAPSALPVSNLFIDIALAPPSEFRMASAAVPVQVDATCACAATIVGRRGAVGSGYLALIFLDADGQELGRRVRWIDDFSGEPKTYVVSARPFAGAMSVLAAYRVNTELPPEQSSAVITLALQSLESVSVVQTSGLAETYDAWDVAEQKHAAATPKRKPFIDDVSGDMDIQAIGQHWEALAQADPLGATLGWKDRQPWDWHPERSFLQANEEISATLLDLDGHGISVRRGRALDFGCGLGQLTQALAQHFEKVDGVDISPTMVKLARHYNRFGNHCLYHLNEAPDLMLFNDASFDFIVTRFVMQHMRPEYSINYIREFIRLLSDGGIGAFQLLTKPPGPSPNELAESVRRDPMPDEAFRAEIVPDHPQIVTQPALWLSVGARVRNNSKIPWPDGRRLLALGNHWLSDDGTMLKENDARAPLPSVLEPDQETHLVFQVRAPAEKGEYVLELDLVQDFVAWFASKGSPTVRIPVTVKENLDELTSQSPPVLVPRIELHTVPRDIVESAVQTAGGKVVLVRSEASTSTWESLWYYVIYAVR
jgi:SAM-dependent methyltransferase